MKHDLRLIIIIVGLLPFLGLNAQVDTTTVNNGEKSELAIDGLVKKSTVTVEGDYAYRTFEIEIAETGEYFLSAWLMGAQTKDGDYAAYDLIINGVKQIAKIVPTRSNWQSMELKNENSVNNKVKLSIGLNKVIFVSKLPDVADVEFVKFSKDANSVKLDDSKYTNYIKEARVNMELNKGLIGKDSITEPKMQKVFQLSNPESNYTHYMDVTFSYTTYKTYYFSAGQQVFFTTYAPSGYEHVLEVFSAYYNTENYSWAVKSGSNNMASLNINIPVSDTYYVRVRAYRQTIGAGGVVNLNVNGQYYFADTPVAGYGFAYSHSPQEVLNYFSTNNTGDPRIWIESSNGSPGTICAYNDDYINNGGDWSWGLNPRIKKQIGRTVSAVLLSTYGSYNPTAICDLYIGCKNSNITNYFPLLKADDAIQSGSASRVYNCTSWAGGITRGWFWGVLYDSQIGNPIPGEPVYGNPQVWSTWDNYFGNNPYRYTGATTYTPIGANADNAVIAMWALSSGNITHASVRGYANGHPHGYNWESKPGDLMRTFHPRDALNGDDYGSIVKYYRNATGNVYAQIKQDNQPMKVPTKNIYTFEQSVQAGLTVIEDVTLNETEKDIISSRNKSTVINKLYDNWVNEIKSDKYSYISNPYTLIETESGKTLLEYAKNNFTDALPLFANVIFETNDDKLFEQNISYYMFCEIAKDKYGDVIEQIKKDWQNKSYNEEGSYIAPLPETFTKKYIKQLINNEYALNQEKNNNEQTNNSDLMSIAPNPVSETSTININLPEKSTVSIKIIDSNGIKEFIFNDKLLDKGTHSFKINYPILPQGLNICVAEINGKTYVRKLLKK